MCFLLTNTGKISGNDENNTDNVSKITCLNAKVENHRNSVGEHEDLKAKNRISLSHQIRCYYDRKESKTRISYCCTFAKEIF